MPLLALKLKVVSSVQPLQVLLSIEVRLDIRYPLIALVPPAAPDQVSVIVSLLCISGNATAVLGAVETYENLLL